MAGNGNTPPKLTESIRDNDHTQGPRDAAVTLVQYGDFECPHCLEVYPIVQALERRLPDNLCVVYRHFPITMSHPHAQLAAEASEAAGAQGKFWEMHDMLYEHQTQLEYEDLVHYAEVLELDMARFTRELEEHTYRQKIRQDFLSGTRSGVNGTPTFYINGRRYDGAWDLDSLLAEIEKPLGARVRYIFQEFSRIQASGGLLLLLSVILALLWANSPAGEVYFQFWETEFGFELGEFHLSASLLEWVNDGLMAIFFFVVGLEIKREVTVGELASPRRAALPIAAAVGGILVPALIYLSLNIGGPGESGWGIPVATDIAFTLGLLALLGSRVPLSLKITLTAMAIADDMGAVAIIAIFYSDGIVISSLLIAGLMFILLMLLNRSGVYSPLPYAVLGLFLWVAFLQSGIHPTIAGVVLALTIPTRPEPNTQAFLAQCQTIFGQFEPIEGAHLSEGIQSGRQQAAAQALERILERMQSPAQRLERALTPWSTYVILPIFALANAGVVLTGDPRLLFSNPISLGIILGLVVGKPIGVTVFSYLAERIGLARMPADLHWPQFISASFLAGIGFTISLFIANSAFSDPVVLNLSKIAILVASLIAAILGLSLVGLSSRQKMDQVTHVDIPISEVEVGA